MEKSVGGITVYLVQDPLSPLVNEPVKMAFIFSKAGARLTQLDLVLTLTDTFYGDATKDKTILKKNLKTDNNGVAEYQYSFNKENYFDVDLKFKDPANGEEKEVGFLVQPRNSTSNKDVNWLQIASGALSGLVIGVIVINQIQRRNNRE